MKEVRVKNLKKLRVIFILALVFVWLTQAGCGSSSRCAFACRPPSGVNSDRKKAQQAAKAFLPDLLILSIRCIRIKMRQLAHPPKDIIKKTP